MKITFFERKFNPDVISIEKLFNVIRENLKNKSIEIEVVNNPYDIKSIWKSVFFFKKRQGKINHISGDIHWASLLLDRRKLVLTIHDLVGLEDLKGIKRTLYYYIWMYFPIKKVKYITVISDKVKEDIIKLIPSSASKIRVIPNCVTIEIKPPIEKNEIKRILIIGTRNNKNIERIIIALKGLDIELSIVGKLNDVQLSLLDNNKINFTNFININEKELIDLYDNSDILCFISIYEGFGLPILEAQARSCNVITSNISPMKEVAGNGAILVDPTNIEEIKMAVIDIMKNKQKRNILAQLGFENVQKYSPDIIINKYIEIYDLIEKEYNLQN